MAIKQNEISRATCPKCYETNSSTAWRPGQGLDPGCGSLSVRGVDISSTRLQDEWPVSHRLEHLFDLTRPGSEYKIAPEASNQRSGGYLTWDRLAYYEGDNP